MAPLDSSRGGEGEVVVSYRARREEEGKISAQIRIVVNIVCYICGVQA